MPKYRDETIKYHIERVREVLALKPDASSRTIRQALEKDQQSPLTLDINYILKIKSKIKGERVHRFDLVKIEERLAEIQDRTESIVTQMWSVLLDTQMESRDRIGAAKVILEAEYKFLEAQMSGGVFEKKLGTLDVKHTHELNPEQKVAILRVLANHGIIKPADNPAGLPDGNRSLAIAEFPRG